MIETRELYRWIEDWADRRGRGLRLSADDRVAVVQTIEALRELARAAKPISDAKTIFPITIDHWKALADALDALAGWETEDD